MPMQPSTKRRQRRSVTLGKGTGYSTKTQPVSAKPSAASKLRAAKKSTSSGKGAGRAPSVDSRAERSKISTAKVTKSGGGTPGSAKVTTGQGGVKSPRAGVHAAVAGEVMRARPVADGTLKGKPTGPKKGPNPTPGKTKSEQFDNAFRAARKAGQKTFTWNGKRYTTEMK